MENRSQSKEELQWLSEGICKSVLHCENQETFLGNNYCEITRPVDVRESR